MKVVTRIPDVPVTALDVFKLLPKGTRAEVINNILYMSPSPLFNHQKLITELMLPLGNHVQQKKLGYLLASPFDVYLEEHVSAVQPDLLFIAKKNKGIIKNDGYAHGAPDLIVEILSQNIERDRKLKKELYEKAGVKEYFIVDPQTKMVEAFVLKGKKYQQEYRKKKFFSSALLKLEFNF
ncbi:MAG: Uma2 family endonuclease [Sphingobacteriales bacterium]|nr:Uma2 family endonuclease [Sphingobacteriales bacterium]MBI3719912.1 Uma2 family endonuclease [Sphingobacteriales bacterium]